MNQVLCNPKNQAGAPSLRKAIVYLRQSSEKQVRRNKESQRLQYDVAERMRSVAWAGKPWRLSIPISDTAPASLRPAALKDLNASSARWH